MKKLLIGLLVLGSVSCFAADVYLMKDCTDQESAEFSKSVLTQVKYGLEDLGVAANASVGDCNSFWIANLFNRPTSGWGDESCGVKIKFKKREDLLIFAKHAKLFGSARENTRWLNGQENVASVQVCAE